MLIAPRRAILRGVRNPDETDVAAGWVRVVRAPEQRGGSPPVEVARHDLLDRTLHRRLPRSESRDRGGAVPRRQPSPLVPSLHEGFERLPFPEGWAFCVSREVGAMEIEIGTGKTARRAYG